MSTLLVLFGSFFFFLKNSSSVFCDSGRGGWGWVGKGKRAPDFKQWRREPGGPNGLYRCQPAICWTDISGALSLKALPNSHPVSFWWAFGFYPAPGYSVHYLQHSCLISCSGCHVILYIVYIKYINVILVENIIQVCVVNSSFLCRHPRILKIP